MAIRQVYQPPDPRDNPTILVRVLRRTLRTTWGDLQDRPPGGVPLRLAIVAPSRRSKGYVNDPTIGMEQRRSLVVALERTPSAAFRMPATPNRGAETAA